jgi:hypothetical protein
MTESLSSLVKSSIDSWALHLRADSPLTAAAESGQLSPRALALYLESLRYVFTHSQANIRAAAVRAETLQLSELAAYFRDKASEEQGHDQWAQDDLQQLPDDAVLGIEPAAACLALVALQEVLIDQHPLCFLAYTVWAEYLTASLGAEWLTLLANCGYDRSTVSAVAKHLEADVDHAFEGFDALDRLWRGEPGAADILAGVEHAERGFEAFCIEISALDRPASTARTSAAGDVRSNPPT